MTFEAAKIPSESPAALVKINGRPTKKSLADAQRQLNDNQLRYAVWMSMPENLRVPKTRDAFAASIGVTDTTLWRWSKKPEVVMATRWLTLQNAGDPNHVSNVIEFLYDTTMNIDETTRMRVDAAKEWLKAVGVYEAWKYDNKLISPENPVEFDLDSLSDEELWDLYAQRSKEAGLEPPTKEDFLAQKWEIVE